MTPRSNLLRRATVAACWLIASAAAQSAFAGPLSVSGLITNPDDYSIAELQALGAETVSVSTGVGAGEYKGVSLWSLFGGQADGTSNVITQGGGGNPILRNYVTALGSDSARSIISMGEINPQFGGTGTPYIVAYEKNGVPLQTPQLIVPLDGVGRRDVFDLKSLQVSAVPQPPVGPGGTSSQLTVSGQGISPQNFNLAALQAMPAVTETVQFRSGQMLTLQTQTYTGVKLWDFLEGIGATDEDDLDRLLLVTGSDGFQVAFSIAELSPFLDPPQPLPPPHQPANPVDLLAYGQASGPDGLLGSAGFARLAIPGDFRGGRYVSNIVSIEVLDVPEPASMIVMAVAIAAFAATPRRRRSRPPATA